MVKKIKDEKIVEDPIGHNQFICMHIRVQRSRMTVHRQIESESTEMRYFTWKTLKDGKTMGVHKLQIRIIIEGGIQQEASRQLNFCRLWERFML